MVSNPPSPSPSTQKGPRIAQAGDPSATCVIISLSLLDIFVIDVGHGHFECRRLKCIEDGPGQSLSSWQRNSVDWSEVCIKCSKTNILSRQRSDLAKAVSYLHFVPVIDLETCINFELFSRVFSFFLLFFY